MLTLAPNPRNALRPRKRDGIPFLLSAAFVLIPVVGFAADWPMWRHDPLRSGATTEKLPDKLQVEWERELPQFAPAWPEISRSRFDAAYEPVVAGNRLFLASPRDGSIRAFAVEDGQQLWCFYTNGPARFAPVVWNHRVFAVSDDGFLYALEAGTGRLLWKVNGSGRPAQRMLGNNRLVSWWVARGGPVVVDGVVYFAAGIWPTHGIYVQAVDAATGKVLWTNKDGFWIPEVRIDHNERYAAGLSPQGYLVVVGDRLLVPNGRSMPAGFDRKTGKRLYYVQGYRHGDCRVVASPRFAFVGHEAVVDVATGREVGSKWKAAGKNAPPAFDPKKFDLFEGPIFPYKFMPGCDAWSVVTSTRVYGLSNGVFFCYDLTQPKVSEYDRKQSGYDLKPWRWDLPRRWELRTPEAGKHLSSRALLLAGRRLYGNTGDTIWAVDLPAASGGKPHVVWSLKVSEEPVTMAAAAGKLFVGTATGRLLCLGDAGAAPQVPKRFALQTASLPAPAPDTVAEAQAIVRASGVRGGFAVLLGVRNTPDWIAALLAVPKLRIIAVVRESAELESLRDKLVAAGVYGTRVEVFATGQDPVLFALLPFLANLIVADVSARDDVNEVAAGLFQSLRPYGGAAWLKTNQGQHAALTEAVRGGSFEQAQCERTGSWTVLRRRDRLPGAAEWTHECGDAARTFYSRDARLRAPLGVLWYGDGEGYGFYKYHDYGAGVKPQVAGGRIVALRQKAPAVLCALDAYTGLHLWTRRVGRFTRYATFPDVVYIADGDHLVAVDAATGAVGYDVKLDTGHPAADKPTARDIRVAGDTVAVTVGFGDIPGGAYMLMQVGGLWDSKVLVAVDRATGKQLWRREAENRFNNNAFAAGDGLVFCTDSFSPVEGARLVRRGVGLTTVDSTVYALDARTGAVRWQRKVSNPYQNFPPGNWLGQRSADDWLGYSAIHNVLLAGRSNNMYAFAADSGKELWERKGGGAQPVIIRDDTCLTQAGLVLNLLTGKPRLNYSIPMRKHGCNYAVVGVHLQFLRDAFVAYTDLDRPTLDRYWLRNIRSGCDASLVAADGLLSVPNLAMGCVCNYPLQTSFAMTYMPAVADWARPKPLRRPARKTKP